MAAGGIAVPSRPRPVRVPAGLVALSAWRVDAATLPLLGAVAVLVLRAILAPFLDAAQNDAASAASQTAVGALAGVAVLLGLRSATGAHRHYGLRVLAGLVVILVLSISVSGPEVLATNEWLLLALYAGAAVMTMYQLTPLVVEGVSRPVLVTASLDMVIFFASGLAVAASASEWQGVEVSDATIGVLVCLMAFIAWTATAATVLFARGVRGSFGGPYFMVGGLSLVGICGASWIASADIARYGIAGPADFVFSVGAVMIARGWLTWSLEASERRSAWLVETGRDLVSTTSIIVAVIVVVLDPEHGGAATRLGTVGDLAILVGVVAAGIRQVAIKEHERRARDAEAATAARLLSEIAERGRVARALEGAEPATTLAETAQLICDRLLGLPNADFIVVTTLEADADGVPLAVAGIDPDGLVGVPLEAEQAQHLRERAAEGVWTERAARWLEPWLPVDALHESPHCVHVPLVWEEALLGVLTLGSLDPADLDLTLRHEATAREAAVMVAALVGPALTAESAARRRRERIERLIAEHQFHPVFQPIVELTTERIVGFEALTRFDDGGRPDAWFGEAAAAGCGPELEVATLAAAVQASACLPPECYVSLNLSPDVVASVELLGPVLTRVSRQVLLEITEHVPVEDYERMMANLYALDIKIRLAVDDAGAGYAGLQHILAIRPQVVKLDTALVRFVDVDLARQALVGAMVSFAARTGCTIVAEGVETASEVAMLRSIGVGLAQGYYFGRPQPAEAWAAPAV